MIGDRQHGFSNGPCPVMSSHRCGAGEGTSSEHPTASPALVAEEDIAKYFTAVQHDRLKHEKLRMDIRSFFLHEDSPPMETRPRKTGLFLALGRFTLPCRRALMKCYLPWKI